MKRRSGFGNYDFSYKNAMLFVVGAALLILIIILCSRSSSKFGALNLTLMKPSYGEILDIDPVYVSPPKLMLDTKSSDGQAILEAFMSLDAKLRQTNTITYFADGGFRLYYIPPGTKLTYADDFKQRRNIIPTITLGIEGVWPNVKVVSSNTGRITSTILPINLLYTSPPTTISTNITDNPPYILNRILDYFNFTNVNFNAMTFDLVSRSFKLYNVDIIRKGNTISSPKVYPKKSTITLFISKN
jgi:hypothetical protein